MEPDGAPAVWSGVVAVLNCRPISRLVLPAESVNARYSILEQFAPVIRLAFCLRRESGAREGDIAFGSASSTSNGPGLASWKTHSACGLGCKFES